VSTTVPVPSAAPARRRAVAAFFAVYLVLLVWIVLWKLGVPSTGHVRALKLVPFVAGDGYGASTPMEMTANVLLFVPLGAYLGLLAPRWRWWAVTGVGALVSVALETAQYVLAVGSTDSSDVILNTAGVLLGVAALAAARGLHRARGPRVIAWACALVTVLAVAGTAAVVTSPIHLHPPRGHLTQSSR
jgi:glycopeptide antibiotics resistance protein